MKKILVAVVLMVAAQSSFADYCKTPSGSNFAVSSTPSASELARCKAAGGKIVKTYQDKSKSL